MCERESAREKEADLALLLKISHLRIKREAREDHRRVDLGAHLFFSWRWGGKGGC